MRGQDLLTALADELKGVAPELAQAYDAGNDPAAATRANDSYVTSVTRLSEAAGYVGLEGVRRICACVLGNLDHLDEDDADARVLVRPFFIEWAPLLEAHLRDANAPGPINALLEHFGGGWVPLPLETEALAELRGELLAASSIGASLDESEDAAPETLTAADLTLEISGDVDAALIDAFMNDSPPQAAEVTQSLTAWIAAPAQADLLLNAKRAAHTLKGSANILGIRGVAKLAHRLEDVLEICEVDGVAPSDHRARALMAAADCLAQMVAAVAGEDAPPDNALAVIDMLDAARDNNFAREDAAPVSPAALAAAAAPLIPATPRAEARAMTRVPTQLLDDLVRMVGELTIKVGEFEQELKSSAGHSRQLVDQDRSIQKRLFELENSVDIRGLAARHKLHAVGTP
ncbi:MAG TPA: Hpt domain-containing protein, partial [Steroidobacteraceae bacterium]|nr:Hpt domain-containing protein [Steroidobacteraceae bacterium]